MATSFRCWASFLICILFVAEAYSAVLQPQLKESIVLVDEPGDHGKEHGSTEDRAVVTKRSTDWSKKISEADLQQQPAPAPSPPLDKSEVKQPQVRRIRIHNGAKKILQDHQGGEVKEIDTPAEHGVKKVVRVKKLRRKPKRKMTTTAVPEVVTSLDEYLSSPVPKISTQPGFDHITVVNREGPKSPKLSRRRKKKQQQQQPVATVYDSEAKQNAVAFVTALPRDQHPEVLLFNPPMASYPDFGGYFTGRQASPGNQQFVVQHRTSPADLRQFGHIVTWTSQPEGSLLQQHQDSLVDQFPSYYRGPFFANGGGLKVKPLVPQLGRMASPARTSDQPAPEPDTDSKTKATAGKLEESAVEVVERSGNAATTPPSPPKETPALQNATKAGDVVEKLIEVLPPLPPVNNNAGGRLLQNGHPLHQRQKAFVDPFFNTPPMRSTGGSPALGVQQFFSPFYSPASDDSQSEEYLFAPFQPGAHLLVPGFHPSPQLTSLRRSILDDQPDEREEAVPVTPFSLPKFEMPAIDFNDEGCRTVYKEVKTAPGTDDDQKKKKGSEESAKSFVISRECYFPNGIPTRRQEGKAQTTKADDQAEGAKLAAGKESSTTSGPK